MATEWDASRFNDSRTNELLEAAIARSGPLVKGKTPSPEILGMMFGLLQIDMVRDYPPILGPKGADIRRMFDILTFMTGCRDEKNRFLDAMLADCADLRAGRL